MMVMGRGSANPVLDDWKVLTNGRVVGKVKFHPSIPDGETITTSPVTKPELAGPRKIVTTFSGSKYMLGTPKMLPEIANGKQQTAVVSLQELQRRAKVEYALNGDVIGDDSRQYLLAGKATKSTSGKSQIFKCYKANPVDGLPMGDALTAKISSNWEAIEREAANYNRITKAGVTRGQFVTLLDFLPTASIITKKYSTSSALIMERGAIDLKRYIAVNGALSGKELRDAASAAAQCLQAVHDSGLVWTDMKTENFVVTEEGQVKGIDLESAMPVRDNPVDYSPEATPPEFAKAFLDGDGPYFVLQQKYDMWSFGMLLYELATGKGYWDGRSPIQITRALRDEPTIELDDVEFDEKLKNLIQKLLQIDPKSRLGIVQVLLHPYFLTTGFGPFGF
jgi:serine/threonine protein kinase